MHDAFGESGKSADLYKNIALTQTGCMNRLKSWLALEDQVVQAVLKAEQEPSLRGNFDDLAKKALNLKRLP